MRILMQWILSLLMAASVCRAGDIRALILTGAGDHDWRSTAPCLKKILLDTGRFDVRVDEEPLGISEATLAGYDVLIVHYHGVRLGAAAGKAIERFVKSGKGIVAIHNADYAFGGHFSGIQKEHGPRQVFTVRYTDGDNPIDKGLPETFVANDELDDNLKVSPNAKIIATAGKNEPIIWTMTYGKGRGLYNALGHDTMAMHEPGFKTAFAREVEWAATGSVAPAAAARQENPVRVLVAVGGHMEAPSFFSLFEGYPEMSVQVQQHPQAFASDFRKKYDVLVLYDMLDDLNEAERQHLKEFVESGKGVVSLHWAVLDYDKWPWWHEEVVGGKFIRPVNGQKVTLNRNDVDMVLRPVGKHPITDGIGPLHVVDEAYKKLWISPKVQVLLETDSPDSDRPVAWISAYEKSKVVYIQPGHAQSTYLNPGYRELVRNAVLWSAGRLQ